MPTILIADDDERVRTCFATIARHSGFDVALTAANGVEAVDLFKAHRVDLVVSDCDMPGQRDSLGVVREIRNLDRNVPLLVITGLPSASKQEQAQRLGVTDYLVKPLTMEQLTDAFTRSVSGVTA